MIMIDHYFIRVNSLCMYVHISSYYDGSMKLRNLWVKFLFYFVQNLLHRNICLVILQCCTCARTRGRADPCFSELFISRINLILVLIWKLNADLFVFAHVLFLENTSNICPRVYLVCCEHGEKVMNCFNTVRNRNVIGWLNINV